MLRRGWKWLGLIFGGWTLFAFFYTCQSHISNAYYGRPVPFGRTLAVWLTCAYIWALLTPLILHLARRFAIERGMYRRGLTVHLFAGALVSLFQLGIFIFVSQWLLGDPSRRFSPLESFRNLFVAQFQANLLIYWSVVGMAHAYEYYRRYRERERRAAQLELEASQLETQLTRAQLDALKAQLHPHFLFNTLNTISVLMLEDIEVANRMLLRLSDLLRLALKNAGTHEVPLRQEIEFLRSYLEIEQTRFHDRLMVRMEIEPEALEARVPNLVLQPLVENAIRYAVAPREVESAIEIRATRRNGLVELQVRDDGPGIDEMGGEAANGIGLANTRSRLDKLYGAAHSFRLSSAIGGGTQVTITIPFRPVEGSEVISGGQDQGVDH